MSLEVTINVPNFLIYLLTGVTPIGEDKKDVIGDSRLAYLGQRHPFAQAAKLHDKRYSGIERSKMGGGNFTRFQADEEFLKNMLPYIHENEDLTKQAVMLFLFVRHYGEDWWVN
jgi:hypothetical protein